MRFHRTCRLGPWPDICEGHQSALGLLPSVQGLRLRLVSAGTPSHCPRLDSHGTGPSPAVQPSPQVQCCTTPGDHGNASCPMKAERVCNMTLWSSSLLCSSMSSHLCRRSMRYSPAGKAPAPEWGGVAPVWWSLMRSHNEQPLHALLRGGGQINGDRIFEVRHVGYWCRFGRLAPARGVHRRPVACLHCSHSC